MDADAAEDAADYSPGDMEVVEQVSTYRAFNGLVKWGSLAIAALLILLVLWFCTGAGFVPAAIVTLIVTGLGVAALRSRASPGAH